MRKRNLGGIHQMDSTRWLSKQHGVQGAHSAFQVAIAIAQFLHSVLLHLEFSYKRVVLLAYEDISQLCLLDFLEFAS